jgi:positive regulator of sigma E activity
MIDALRGIVQFVYTGIFQVVFRRGLLCRKLEIMVQEKSALKYRMVIYVLLLLLLLLLLTLINLFLFDSDTRSNSSGLSHYYNKK